MKKANKEQKQLSIQVSGPMLDILVHCSTEAQTIKTLKELKNLVSPATETVRTRVRIRWTTKIIKDKIPVPGKIPGKHHFQIIHNHPQHPLNFK